MPTLRERLIESLGGVTRAEKTRSFEAGYSSGYADGEDEPPTGTLANYGYRRQMAKNLRDFSRISHQQMLNVAWSLYQSSLLAKRLLAIKRDHIIGRGVMPTCDDPDLQELLTRFWLRNRLDQRATDFTLQLFLFGEQCLPAFVKESTGEVTLGYIDPGSIKEVECHPENVLEQWAIVVERRQGEFVVYRIVRADRTDAVDDDELLLTADQALLEEWEPEMLKRWGLDAYTGSCFFGRVNSISNNPRGYSDLMQLADWIDQADQTLFALADREQMAGYFSWNVKLIGANQETVDARAGKIRKNPPGKGSVNVHNDSEEWTFNYPDLKQPGTIESFRALLGFIVGGLGFPVHWFGFGDDANRATATMQGDPSYKTLEHDQGVVGAFFTEMLSFVRDQAIIAGEWTQPAGEEGEYEVGLQLPEITTRDYSKLAPLMPQLATALQAAEDSGWLTTETAARVWAHVIAELGVEVDAAAELEQLEKEREEEERQGANAFGNGDYYNLTQSRQGAKGSNGNGAGIDMLNLMDGEG